MCPFFKNSTPCHVTPFFYGTLYVCYEMYVFSNKVYLIFSSIEFRGKSYEDFMISVEKSSPLLLIWILISSVYWSGEFLKLFAKWAKHAIPSRTALSLDHAHSCASIHNILRFVLFFVHNYKYREHLGEKNILKDILRNPIELPHYGFPPPKKLSQLSYLNLIAFYT